MITRKRQIKNELIKNYRPRVRDRGKKLGKKFLIIKKKKI